MPAPPESSLGVPGPFDGDVLIFSIFSGGGGPPLEPLGPPIGGPPAPPLEPGPFGPMLESDVGHIS